MIAVPLFCKSRSISVNEFIVLQNFNNEIFDPNVIIVIRSSYSADIGHLLELWYILIHVISSIFIRTFNILIYQESTEIFPSSLFFRFTFLSEFGIFEINRFRRIVVFFEFFKFHLTFGFDWSIEHLFPSWNWKTCKFSINRQNTGS